MEYGKYEGISHTPTVPLCCDGFAYKKLHNCLCNIVAMAAAVATIGPGSTLMTREMPPERPTIQSQGSVLLEQVYQGNTGNDMGISTVGYRSAKYNPSEWHESNYSKYYQAFVDRDNAERIRHESKRTEKG